MPFIEIKVYVCECVCGGLFNKHHANFIIGESGIVAFSNQQHLWLIEIKGLQSQAGDAISNDSKSVSEGRDSKFCLARNCPRMYLSSKS